MELTTVLKDSSNAVLMDLKVPVNSGGGEEYSLKDLEISLRMLQAEVNSALTGLLDQCEKEAEENCPEAEEDESEDEDSANGAKRNHQAGKNASKKIKNS